MKCDLPLNVGDAFDAIACRYDLPPFLVGYRNVGYKAVDQRRFPHLHLGREGITDLSVALKQRTWLTPNNVTTRHRRQCGLSYRFL